MAILRAKTAYNDTTLDFRKPLYPPVGQFFDNANMKLGGTTYTDVIAFEFPLNFPAQSFTLYVAGPNLPADYGSGSTNGSVTGLFVYAGAVGDFSKPQFSIQGTTTTEWFDVFAALVSAGDNGSTYNLLLQALALSDTIYLSNFDDVASGSGGADVMYGFGGNDVLNGQLRNDLLFGGDGNDTLDGGLGKDWLDGGAGNDTLIGGDGRDTASYRSATTGVTVSLATTTTQDTGGAGSDTLTGIENLSGSAFADTLTGDAGANILYGKAEADKLDGAGGNDRLFGDTGHDELTGGSGRDSFYITSLNPADWDVVTDFSHAERDTIRLSHSVFTGLAETAGNPISADEFYAAAGATAAHDATDRVIYDTTSGRLYYDADGTGTAFTAVQIATLGTDTHPALYYSDIFVA